MALPISLTEFADSINPAIHEIFDEGVLNEEVEYKGLFTTKKSDQAYEIVSNITRLPIADTLTEGGPITLAQPYQGYDYTKYHSKYGLGFSITEEMRLFAHHEQIKNLPQQLAKSQQERKELDGANIFNNAFAGGTLWGDGVVLCSASHPNPTGGAVMSNLLTTPADFSVTSLKAALTQSRKMVDSAGLYLRPTPDLIVSAPDYEFEVDEILHSEKIANSANNNKNSLSRYGLTWYCLTRMTDIDAWFLVFKNRDEARLYEAKLPDLVDDLHINSRNIEYNSTQLYMYLMAGWRWLIGTPGA